MLISCIVPSFTSTFYSIIVGFNGQTNKRWLKEEDINYGRGIKKKCCFSKEKWKVSRREEEEKIEEGKGV